MILLFYIKIKVAEYHFLALNIPKVMHKRFLKAPWRFLRVNANFESNLRKRDANFLLALVKHEQDNKDTYQSAKQKQILCKAMCDTTQDVVSAKLTSGSFRICT